MQITRTQSFKKQFRDIIFYIAKDKKDAARNFKNKLNNSIDNLDNFPYKYRKSYYYDDENIRDMVFKSYTIIYRVNKDKNIIEILEIFNQNLPISKGIK